MKKLLTLTAALALAAGVITEARQAGQQTPAETKDTPSVGGKWNVSIDMQGNVMNSGLEIKLDGKKVVGTITDRQGNPTPIQGEFADGKLSFALTIDGGNGPMQIGFNGALKDNGTLAGTMDLGPAAQGMQINWTAERVKDVAAPAAPATQEPPKKADPKALNIAGKWTMALDMSIGQATPALVFKQDGEKLTGTYAGRYGTFEFKGTLKEKDRALQFSFQMDTDGGSTTMAFDGTVTVDGQTMKGTGTIEGLGDVTWTAKREKD